MWAAYGAVEVLLAVMVRRALLTVAFVPPDDWFTLSLLVLYPLVGALLGRFAVVGLAIAFVANAVAVVAGPALAAPLVGGAIVVAIFRNSPWVATLLLLLPLTVARELGFTYTFRTKVLLSGAAFVAVIALGLLAKKRDWSLKPAVTIAIFALLTIAATFIDMPAPRDLPPDEPPPRVSSPNIVLVVMDTVRAANLSVYGYGRNTTPELVRFAKSATLYTRAYSPSNMTLPSHASLFTGLYGSEHTAHYDDAWIAGRPLPPRALTIAELLAARGYATASIVSNGYLGEPFGLGQGFHHLDARPPRMPYGTPSEFYLRSSIGALASRVVPPPRGMRRYSRGGEEISDLAIAYLDRVAGKRRPFFLVLNYLDAHHPYIPPAPFNTMFAGHDASLPPDLSATLLAGFASGKPTLTPRERAHLISQYDGSIAFADQQIARVFAALRRHGVYDRTLIIVLADHGEAFGEHGILTHGLSNYDPETHVPLIVKSPGQTTSAVVTQPVSILDTWPMLTSMPHAPFPVITESFPLRGAGTKLPSRRPGTAKIDGTLKTIVNVNGPIETYDLATDPGETRNLAPNAESQRMAADIAAWRKSLRDLNAPEAAPKIDPETLRRLRALGYVQ